MPLMHATPDALELYVLHMLKGPDLDTLEEHFLVCETCRSAFETVEQEVHALQKALKDFELEDRKRVAQSKVDSEKLVLFK